MNFIRRCMPFAVLLMALQIVAQSADQQVSWQRQAGPLLTKYCAGCHNATEPEGGLSVQTPVDLRKGSEKGPVLNAANPTESRLLQVLLSTDTDHMPPADEAQPTADELKLLQAWIVSGAPFDGSATAMLAVPEISPKSHNPQPAVLSLAISADGAQLFKGLFRSIEVVDRDGRTVQHIPVDDGKVTDLVVESGGKTLLAATGIAGFSGRAVRVNREDGTLVAEFGGHSDMVYAVTATGDASLIATAGYDRRILIHDAISGELLRTLSGHNGAVFDLQFSPDGAILASASADGTVKVWNPRSGERLDTLSQPQAEQYTCVFSPDGRFLYAAGADNRIRKWRVESRSTARINPLLEARFAHESIIHAMVMSADGRLLATAAEDGTVKIWDPVRLIQLASYQLSETRLMTPTFDGATGDLLVGTSQGDVRRYTIPADLNSGPHSGAEPEAGSAQPAMRPLPVLPDSPMQELAEQEPNDQLDQVMRVTVPVTVTGTISQGRATSGESENTVAGEQSPAESASHADLDGYRFAAVAGVPVLMEVRAARDQSPLDSLIRVLTPDGQPVLQTRLQAVRDSYFTFRGKDSDTSDDFRMFNWQEMELNEYLYADGEVVRLWLYPRGPDSGFKVYPGFGKRYTYFGTTATAHALQAPAFIVKPQPPGESFPENGLPVFPVYFENDDDPQREWGWDSRLTFTPPADGDYIVQISDARGFGGDDFRYKLTLRPPRPDFSVTVSGNKVALQPGTGRELMFSATRIDGFDGPIELTVENLPPGFSSSLPTEIEADQLQAFATLLAAGDATQPAAEDVAKIRFVARAVIQGQPVSHEAGGLSELTLGENPRIAVTLHTVDENGTAAAEPATELTVIAGQTTRALLRVDRQEFKGNVEFGKEDAGRNLPHGVFVDNIGLNGLMLLPGQTEREVFITVAGWVPETTRPFYLKSSVDGITTQPVLLHVRHRAAQ